jgi:hypothetical protein
MNSAVGLWSLRKLDVEILNTLNSVKHVLIKTAHLPLNFIPMKFKEPLAEIH